MGEQPSHRSKRWRGSWSAYVGFGIIASGVIAGGALSVYPLPAAADSYSSESSSTESSAEVAAVETPASDTASASVPAAAPDQPLPHPLSDSDAERYRHIFALQHDGDWRSADAEIAKLQDRVLIGHVLAQRYLRQRLYHASYAELGDWLAHYLDHPEATQIYALALRHKPAKTAAPQRPDGAYLAGLGADFGTEGESFRQERDLSDADARKAQKLKAHIRADIRAGWPTGAKKKLEDSEARNLLDAVEYDELRSDIAAAYFAYGKDEEALSYAEETAAHAGIKVPAAHWIAGIAAWRLGRPEDAIKHFEAVVKSPAASQWEVAGAAFWAARANLVSRRPDEVSRWLKIAAERNHTFYGLLARRVLGMDANFDWEAPQLDAAALQRFDAIPGAHRAFALLQADEQHYAESEMRKIYATADADLADAVLALSLHGEFPGLAMRIGVEVARNSGRQMDAALYPLPSWKPERGYTMDRALLFAVIRQESRFDAGAESYAGARGLMQIMPETAKFIANHVADAQDGDDSAEESHELFDPSANIALGQRYLTHLVEDESVHGDLFLLAAAYNGGPAKVAEWRRRINDHGDPLLFIESIPSRETRGFVERVLANMWIYEQRLGQPTPSLDEVAAGNWPAYAALDGRGLKVAGDDGN